MITATKRWLRKNQVNFAIGFGVIGAGYIAGQYVISKLAEARERMASDRVAKENLRRRFQQNQEDCTITVLELLPTVTEHILEALPSETITHELQQKRAERLGRSAGTSEVAPSESSAAPSVTDEDGKSFSSESYVHASQAETPTQNNRDTRPARTKVQLWTELKISSVTRAFTLIYTVALLSLLTRIQLNLLGRKNYLSSVVSQVSNTPKTPTINLENREDDASERSYGNDFETNRKYLTFSWWLLHRGWRDLRLSVETAVKEVFGPLKPTEDIPLEKLSSLIIEVRKLVEGATSEERSARKWLPYLLPPREEEASVLQQSGVSTTSSASPVNEDHSSLPSTEAHMSTSNDESAPPLRRLLDETADLVDSPLFPHVLTYLLDAAFSLLTDQKLRSEAYKLQTQQDDQASRMQEIPDDDPSCASAKLATILAVMTREAHKIGNGMPNEYVQALESVSDLEGFAAVIYSNNFDLAIAADDINALPAENLQSSPGVYKETPVPPQAGSVLYNKASHVADAAWDGFGSVWSRVIGS